MSESLKYLKLKYVTLTASSGLCFFVEVAYGTKWYVCEYSKASVNSCSISLRCTNRENGTSKKKPANRH